MEARAPGTETVPDPQPGERVVFGAHFDRGLGLPASAFFRRFLEYFGLQPQHLPANAFAQTADGNLRSCGAASIYSRQNTPFPKIPTADSVKKWQQSFFYVKSANAGFDWVNLPEFDPAPPTARKNWGNNFRPADPEAEVNLLWTCLQDLVTVERLCATDLLCCYASRRVLPLQARAHKICHMSSRLDPTRTYLLELTKAQVARRVNHISQAKLPENWDWGLEPYSRRELPPAVGFPSSVQRLEDGDLAHKQWVADHVDPADEAGDDENLEAPDHGPNDVPSSPQPHDEDPEPDVPASSEPIPAVPLAVRPPAASSSSTAAPQGWKRPTERSTARQEARAKKLRRAGPKPVPETAGAAIKLAQGAGSGSIPAADSGLQRRRREPTPLPPSRPRTPPVVPPPSTGAVLSSVAPSPGAPGSGARGEPAPRGSQPTLDQMFPRRVRIVGATAGAGRGAGGAASPAAGVGGSAPEVVILDASSDEAPPAPDSTVPTGPASSTAPPLSSEPARDEPVEQEPARDEPAEHEPVGAADADARALVTTRQGSVLPPEGLYVAKAAMLTHVVSASESSLGSAGTMEKDWHRAGACEVTSRDGRPGVAPMDIFFSGFRAMAKRQAEETEARLARLEAAEQTVADRRTALYNRLVVGYHKAKNERAEMARELEAAQAVAARVPQLEAHLRTARERCATAEETAKTLTAKVQETHGELERLRRLESSHVLELKEARETGRKEVEDLSRRLKDVEQQCQALRDEVTSKSQELTDTAKRWVTHMSVLDRGLAAAFPEAQAEALAAAGRARDERRRTTGEQSLDCFSMDDYLASMAARVEPITKLGWELRKAAEELCRLLWPTETLPQELGNFFKWLESAPDRFLDWKESAARAGADMALSFVLSWYNEVSLDQLEYRHAGVEEKLPAENKTARLARACAIAAFVDKGVFITDPNPPEDDSDEEPEDEEIEMESPPGARPTGPPPAGA
ncbi:hypothetical protein QYE76_043260 [Lolium multiflorum]|uniref:Transposase (putative) gypsy type domain-containing protein n=1 Tax=Lolium multiflorum TaxID=4521 RepID=A0AAD8WVD9_LOLMU|nr:hypothetical protein QYE76_043260 [Lolium multiflorum]